MIGIAVITCNRLDYFKQTIASLPSVDRLVIVNDGQPYPEDVYPDNSIVIQNSKNLGVAVAKNKGLRTLVNEGCQHLFLCEDDIIIKDKHVCDRYIDAASASGIFHLNYGLHGSYNRTSEGDPKIKETMEYGDVSLDFYEHCLGAWSYYHRGVIVKVGYMDERFKNAMEHVDHTYRIIKEHLHPPFWWFADVANSFELIDDIAPDFEGSIIRENRAQHDIDVRRAWGLFRAKHGYIPVQVPQSTEQQVLLILDHLSHNYSNDGLQQQQADNSQT